MHLYILTIAGGHPVGGIETCEVESFLVKKKNNRLAKNGQSYVEHCRQSLTVCRHNQHSEWKVRSSLLIGSAMILRSCVHRLEV